MSSTVVPSNNMDVTSRLIPIVQFDIFEEFGVLDLIFEFDE